MIEKIIQSIFILIQTGGGYSHGSNILSKPPLPQPAISGDYGT